MRKIFCRAVVLLFVFVYLPLSSMAWGMLGHRIVAEIAQHYLNAKAKAAVQKILGNESMAMASNWADFIKSDSNYHYLSNWHWIDFPKGISYEDMKATLKSDTADDAYTRTNFLVRELKKKSLGADKKKLYLRLLIHIVGDLHQPLHVSPHGTSGGNDVRLNWFNEASNLHRVWDEHLINYQQLSYSEYVKAIDFTTAAQRKALQAQPLSQWVFDSFTIAQSLLDEIHDPNPKLTYRYNFDHIATVNDQLLKGGVHLAGLLNEIFGK